MKIAYLTGEYPRATDTFIQREVAALRQNDIDVATCSIRRTSADHLVGREQKEEAARTFQVLGATANPLTALAAQASALRRPARYAKALALAWRSAPKGLKGRLYNLIYFAEAAVLARHMQQVGATHLHNHIAKSSCTVAMLASALSGIPYSFTLHGPDIFFAPEHWRLDEKIARARFVACISEFCRSQAMLWSEPSHWDKLKIIHCGVEPDRYAPGDRTGTNLLFVGRLAAVKGVPILLDAFAKSRTAQPDLTLTFIGDGPDRAQLETRVTEKGLGDAVTFLGYQSQSAVAEVLTKTDALVLPSFAEGVPVVLMEALAAQTPVIATQVGGVSELVRSGENGVLVPPGDTDALADAIVALMGDADLRARMGNAGRKLVEREFDIASEGARLAGLLTSDPLPDGKRPGGAA